MAFLKARCIAVLSVWLALAVALNAQTAAPASVEELATALLAAKSEQDAIALMDAHPALATIELADTLMKQGRSLANTSHFAESLAAFRLARQLAERQHDTKRLIAAMTGIANIHMARSELAAALAIFQQELTLAESLNDGPLNATIQSNLCLANLRLGNYDAAEAQCRQGLALAEANGRRETAGNALNNLGILARLRGDLNKALELYRQTLVIKESLGDKVGAARTLNNIGVAFRAIGNETAALRYYLQSLAIAQSIGNRAGEAGSLGNISMVYRALGNYPLALEYSQRALTLSEAIGDKQSLSTAWQEIGKLHAQAGDYEKALAAHRKSLEVSESTGEKVEIAICLLGVGGAYRDIGNETEAIAYFRRGVELAESIGVPYTMRAGLHQLAQLYLRQGKYAESLDYSERAISFARQGSSQSGLWQSLLTAGAALRLLKQPEAARPRLEEAIRIIETARTEFAASTSEQARFLNNRADAYLQMVMLNAEQNRVEESLHFAERAKARVLLDTLIAGKADISKSMSTDERLQEKQLKDDLSAANTRVTRVAQASKPNPAQVNEAQARLEKARLAYESFQSQLYVRHPQLRSQRGEAAILKTEELAALVDDKTTLLEFVVTSQATYLFAITRAANAAPQLRVYTLPVKEDELTKHAASFRRQLAEQDVTFRAAAKQLYDLLLKPAQAQLAGKTQLIIVPDGKLWELPFQALATPKNQYLIETAAVSYAPSLTVLREMQAARKRRTQATGELLAFGNPSFGAETVKRVELAYRDEKLVPLPEAEAEVKALGQLYGAGSKVYTAAAAREDRLKAEAAQAGVLHIATHGVLNDAAPLYSHLALAASDEKEDGLLEAWELMQMDLQADLAVLSACETARGRIGAGEGVIGLSWALFVAGVPSTLVSQWKVESSSTRDLMLGFHRGLRNQARPLSKAEALRQAVLPLLKKNATNHPFYWAGFVLVGDGQ